MINYTSNEDLILEESLSKSIIRNIHCSNNQDFGTRPSANFVELMNWAEKSFSSYLTDKKNLNKFINNTIVINGQFLKFAEENNISIDVLLKDSVINWRDGRGEKFFVQGAFLIKAPGLEFIQCSLFHKGVQNDDEVSFFVIVSEKNYDKYISIRNKFEDWFTERDRTNNLIRVIGGDDMPYAHHDWNDLVLEGEQKKDLKTFVENFLKSEEFYLKNKIPWKTGILLFGPPGCGKSSIIKTIISNYEFKAITVAPSIDDNGIREAFSYAEEQSPSLLYFEDLDSLLERSIDLSTFLNLMDGISSKNGIMVIATANNFGKLKTSITDRPSRFDRKLKINLPNEKMSYIYLSKWFGKLASTTKLKQLSKFAEENKFSFAHLKELYIASMFEAISKNKKAPTEKDIDSAMDRLIREKNINNKSLNTRKYLKKAEG